MYFLDENLGVQGTFIKRTPQEYVPPTYDEETVSDLDEIMKSIGLEFE